MTVIKDSQAADGVNVVDATAPGSLVGKAAALVHVANPAAAGNATEATLATRLSESDFDTRIGEVQATPTANTLLARVKNVYDKLASFIVARVSDGTGNAITSTDEGGGIRSIDVAIKSSVTPAPVATEGAVIGTTGVPVMGRDGQGTAEFIPVAESGMAHPGRGFMILGTDDTVARALKIRSNGAARVESQPYLYNVAEGNIPGHDAAVKHSHATFATTSRAFLVSGMWNEQVSGAQRSVSSSDAGDSAIGTGARKVMIDYIKSDGTAGTEAVSLNGTTAVDTVASDIKWINQVRVIETGASGAPIGDVSIHSAISGGGVIVSQVLSGHNLGHYGIQYVPSDRSLYVARLEFTATDKFWIEIWSTVDYTGVGGGMVDTQFSENYFDKKGHDTELSAPLIVPGGGRVYAMVTPDAAGESIYATMYGWME